METEQEKISNKKTSYGSFTEKAILALGMLALVAVLFMAGCQQQVQENTINVQGNSQLMYMPNQATVYAGISILMPTAQEAQAEANRVINAIISGLGQAGIASSSIETQQLSLNEEFTQNSNGTIMSRGWRAFQMLKVKTSDMNKVGQIVDECVKNGANQINSINFELTPQKENEYRQTALAEASKNAQSKAEAIASSLNVKLGKIKTVTESNLVYFPYIYTLQKTTGSDAVSEAASVLPSEVTVSATVSLEYFID